jgi:hypothetical protein
MESGKFRPPKTGLFRVDLPLGQILMAEVAPPRFERIHLDTPVAISAHGNNRSSPGHGRKNDRRFYAQEKSACGYVRLPAEQLPEFSPTIRGRHKIALGRTFLCRSGKACSFGKLILGHRKEKFFFQPKAQPCGGEWPSRE